MTASLYYASVEVLLAQEHSRSKDIKGAFVYCFIASRSENEAESAIRERLADDGYEAIDLEFVAPYDLSSPPDWGSDDIQKKYDGYARTAVETGELVYSEFFAYGSDE